MVVVTAWNESRDEKLTQMYVNAYVHIFSRQVLFYTNLLEVNQLLSIPLLNPNRIH